MGCKQDCSSHLEAQGKALIFNVQPVAWFSVGREQVTIGQPAEWWGAAGRVQLLSYSHSIINKENIVMLKQVGAPLCRLHLPHQKKACSSLTGWLPIVSGLVWSVITASIKIIYNYQNHFVWPQGIKCNFEDVLYTPICTLHPQYNSQIYAHLQQF